jgi:hypothetical protein
MAGCGVNDDERSAVESVYAALADGDPAGLRLLLHPYLHWTGVDGVTVRGRTKILALLDDQPTPPGPPAAVELRDGQIYRWQSR